MGSGDVVVTETKDLMFKMQWRLRQKTQELSQNEIKFLERCGQMSFEDVDKRVTFEYSDEEDDIDVPETLTKIKSLLESSKPDTDLQKYMYSNDATVLHLFRRVLKTLRTLDHKINRNLNGGNSNGAEELKKMMVRQEKAGVAAVGESPDWRVT